MDADREIEALKAENSRLQENLNDTFYAWLDLAERETARLVREAHALLGKPPIT